MEKEFNVTGSCNPAIHFMVDIGNKVDETLKLIEKGNYFTINRPRQFGKSTILETIERRLSPKNYLVLFVTFESMSETDFLNEKNFIKEFTRQLQRSFKQNKHQHLLQFTEKHKNLDSFGKLDDFLTGLVETAGIPSVLLIDEVDKSSDNQLFLNFLGLLRSKYLLRHKYPTFQSVILSGVYDVKTLKIKLLPGEERKYNSPWNIAADFNVDLSFTPSEISTMLIEYADYNNNPSVETNAGALSEKLFYYTSGHPFLVSKLCKIIDEEILPTRNSKEWNTNDVDDAFKRLVNESYTTTNFDDMIKNLENNPELYNLVYKIIIDGEKITFNIGNPIIQLGALFGILADSKTGEGLVVHNKVYEQRIYNYISSKVETSTDMDGYNYRDNFITQGNQLDFEKVLLKFQEFMKLQYSNKNQEFLEKDGRLVFLAFIKPIINGRGFDFKEVQISEEKRLDIVITYHNHKYIVELKKWYSQEYHKRGIESLAGYLEAQEQHRGYLLIFDFKTKKKEWKHEKITTHGKEIFTAWVKNPPG